MKLQIRRSVLLILLCTGLIESKTLAAGSAATLARDLEPVVVMGASLPQFLGAAILPEGNELFLYAYRAEQQMWEQIPFQFDERDEAGSYFNPNGDETVGLDDNDELVFMVRDAGDRNMTSWIDDSNSRNFVRFEIEIADPLSEDVAYVYLYRSNTLRLDPNLTDYIEYFGSTTHNVGEDRIRSKFYEIDNAKNGFLQNLSIPLSAGGNGTDILDVLKFQAQTSVADINENNITANQIEIREGLVRLIRIVFAKLKIEIPLLPDIELDFNTPPSFYYPYSTAFEVDIPDLPVNVSSARMSFDLDQSLADNSMKFVSANNAEPGFTLDGFPDNPVKTIDNVLPDGNWVYINGEQGTIVNLFPVALTVGGLRELYYKDDSSNDKNDTGDKMSFGDTGILLAEDVNTPFTLSYKGYFLDRDRSSAIGNEIAQFGKNPLQTTAVPQDFGAVPVELVSFTASVERNDVHLTWTTATETNNFGFDIESRFQGEHHWNKVAFVQGQETSAEPVTYTYADMNLVPGQYEYRLKQIDTDGAFEYSPIVTIAVGVPEKFALQQNFPNPFNPSTLIQYQVAGTGSDAESKRTILTIYNLLGREILTLVDRQQVPGFYSVTWDGRDKNGLRVTTGVYVYQLRSGGFVESKKMILVK